MDTEKKTALITGASRGIGEAVCRRFAAEGYSLALTCRNSFEKLSDIAKDLKEKYNIDCICRQLDVSDHEAVSKLFEDPFFENGLDVLVNNAGISYLGLLHEMSPEDWHRVVGVNLDSVFYHCRYAIPLMLRKHSGHIINISSVWGNAGASMEVCYSASKGGVNAFTKALAKELAPSGISVNAVAAGMIDTDMNACYSDEEKRNVVDSIPADRMGQPGEVADAVFGLVNMPDYLTGQVITIDGGWT